MSRKNLMGYLGIAGIAGVMASQAVFAQGAILPIKKISVDNAQQLVVEFAPGAFPTVPKLLDLPGPNHRIVMDFVDATLDKNSLPAVEELGGQLHQAIPYVKSVRYGDLTKSAKPTARVVIDLPEALTVKPRVVKVEEGSITISFGANGKEVSAAETTETIAAAPATETKPAETTTTTTTTEPAATPATTETAPVATEAAKPAETPVVSEPVSIPVSTPAATPAPTAGWENPATNAQPVASSEPGLRGLDNAPTTPATTNEVPADNSAPLKPEMGAAPATSETTTASAESTSPTESKAARAEAVKRYNAAVQLHLTGKLAEAVAEYQAALQADPNLSEAHSNLGLIHNQQHNYAQALSEFRKALAINPKDAITYNGIGAALRAERDLPGAIKNWLTAVSLDPHLATAYYNLGTAYEIQKVYDKAVDAYKDAVKNDYRLGEAYYRMGLIMERKHRLDDAAQQFSQALKVSSNAEYAEDARQRLSFLTGSSKKATAAKKDAGTQ